MLLRQDATGDMPVTWCNRTAYVRSKPHHQPRQHGNKLRQLQKLWSMHCLMGRSRERGGGEIYGGVNR